LTPSQDIKSDPEERLIVYFATVPGHVRDDKGLWKSDPEGRGTSMKEYLCFLESALKAHVANLLILGAVLFLGLAFVQGSNLKELGLLSRPNEFRLILGGCLLLIGVLIHMLSVLGQPIRRQVNLKKGITIKLGSISVTLKVANIQDVNDTSVSAGIVLPANTAFVDDCIRDRQSALGSFFLEKYANHIELVADHIRQRLNNSGIHPDSEGMYPLGTTVLMETPFDKPCSLILTASTVRRPGQGIHAGPTAVCECIRNVFERTSDKKIEKLYIPILGSGHGGMNKYQALLFLIVSIAHYERSHHHIKQVIVLIREADLPDLKEVYRLQHVSFLEGRK
jgi:hypothetical protein